MFIVSPSLTSLRSLRFSESEPQRSQRERYLGRRDRKDFTGSAYGTATYHAYAYNTHFEVTQGKRFTSGGSAVSGKEFNFTYDDIGNRLTSRDKYTTTTYDTTYTPNAKNQYSGISGYHGASPVTYDTDGNLTDLGSKDFIYNCEDQLIEVKNGSTSLAKFKYDYLGRRVEKFTPSKTETYAYYGWNLIAIYDTGTEKRPLITYSWGLDLSDTMQGAGGVVGLLMSCERDGTAWTYFEDGHGNVTHVISQATGSVNTHMEYDPSGNLVATAPTWDRRNAFRFSSKFYDDETELYYYGFRYLDPVHGRWLNRDPIGEGGGVNLYGFVGNRAVSIVDNLGQCTITVTEATHRYQDITQGSGEVEGYTVQATGCKCDKDSGYELSLVQAISGAGRSSHFDRSFNKHPRYDNTNKHLPGRERYDSPPDYKRDGGGQGSSGTAIHDAPSYDAKLEVCAICVCEKDERAFKVLKCKQFDFASKRRSIENEKSGNKRPDGIQTWEVRIEVMGCE